MLELVGLASVRRKRGGGFSLGMAQRLGIGAALLGDPRVLFDEPINGLDPEGIRWIRGLLHGLAAEGRAIFVCSHLMSEMALPPTTSSSWGRGWRLADASMADLVARHAPVGARLRSPQATELARQLRDRGYEVVEDVAGELSVSGADCAAMGDLAAAYEITVHALASRQASLEAAFLEITSESVELRAHAAVPS